MEIKDEVEEKLLELVFEGNITAIIFWLKNRRPDKWRDKPKDELNTDRKITVVFEDEEGEDYAN